MKIIRCITAFIVLLVTLNSARANVKMPSLFSDNMVLQRDKSIAVWGKADAGERVSVRFAKQTRSVVADASGRWLINLPSHKAALNMALQINGKNAILFKNVAVGDVYVCSGQSNMEYPLQSWSPPGSAPFIAAQREVAAANYPNLRLLKMPRAIAATPASDAVSAISWQPCTSQSARNFSSVAYHFGRDLHRVLDVPIGLIDASWSGTYIEAWMSREALNAFPKYAPQLAGLQNTSRSSLPFEQQMAQWWKGEAGSQANWQGENFDDASWKNATLPQLKGWEKDGLPDFDGVVWFRKSVDVPANWNGQDLTLHLGAIDDRDTTYWNGAEVGSTNVFNAPRHYTISAKRVKPGRNIVAVRVLDSGGNGGFWGTDKMRLELNKNAPFATAPISLEGAWKMRVSADLKMLPPLPALLGENANQPTVLYNGMIAPLLPFALRGAIWYQGEANAGEAQEYRALFPALIRDWRAKFGQNNLGFFWVQLANFLPRDLEPSDSKFAELREAQTLTLALPKTGMATIIDVGDANDIHPTDKKTVGYRLALNALAKNYGWKIESSGPMLRDLKIEGSAIRVRFSHDKGLKTSDGLSPRGFAIADDTHKFLWAQAKLENGSVVLTNPQIENPKYVRYGWANNPEVNLYNGANLPAVPFRSDLNDDTDGSASDEVR